MISKIKVLIKRGGIFGFAIALVKHTFATRERKARKKAYKRAYKSMLTLNSAKERFSEIYAQNLWSSSESGSGTGSEVLYTAPLRQWLIENINSLKIKTFVDAPCGDFNWMKLVLPEVDVKYVGLDIVDDVIEKNIKDHASDKVKFEVADICKDGLPDCDLIMVRDCLFHLSYEDINSFFVNLAKTNYQYLLTTTYKVDGKFENRDIKSGDFRLINLFDFPFSFKPEEVKARVDDFPSGFSMEREMLLVQKQFVPTRLFKF